MTAQIAFLLAILFVAIVLMVTERRRADDGTAVRCRARVPAALLAAELVRAKNLPPD